MFFEENKEFKYSELEKRLNINTLLCKANVIQALHKIKTLISDMQNKLSLYKVKFKLFVLMNYFGTGVIMVAQFLN